MGVDKTKVSALRRFLGLGNALLAIVVVLALLLLTNYLFWQEALRIRVDLSPGDLFTLSPETRKQAISYLDKADAEVRIDAFFYPPKGGDPRDPNKAYFDCLGRIRHDLQETTRRLIGVFDVEGGSRIKTRIYACDRELDAAAQAADQYGVRRKLSPELMGDLIVITAGKNKRLLRLFDLAVVRKPDTPMASASRGPGMPIMESYVGEQAISTALRTIILSRRPKVIFLKGHEEIDPDNSEGFGLASMRDMLQRDGFECGFLDLRRERKIPTDCDILVIVQPQKNITTEEKDWIIEWSLAGGRLFVAHGFSDLYPVGLADLVGPFGIAGLQRDAPPVCWAVPQNGRPKVGVDLCRRIDIYHTEMHLGHPITKPLKLEKSVFRVADTLALKADPSPPEGVAAWVLGNTINLCWLSRGDGQGGVVTSPPRSRGYPNQKFGVALAGQIDTGKEGKQGRCFAIGSSYAVTNKYLADYPGNKDLVLNAFNWLADRTERVTVTPKVRRPRILQPLSPDQKGDLIMVSIYIFPGVIILAGLVVFFLRRR